MITLEQARNLSQDKLSQFVIDEFRKDQLLNIMLFDDVVNPQGGQSLAYTYNRITTLPTAQFRAIGSEYEPQEAATSQYTVNLKVFGGAFEVDRVIQNHQRGLVDHISFQLQQKSQAAAALFSDTFINGDSAQNAIVFDGLDKAVTGSSTEFIPSSILDLSSASAIEQNWKAFLVHMRQWRSRLDGAPTAYLVSREMFAVFQSLADFSTQFTQTKDAFGNEVVNWGVTPIIPLGDKPGTSKSIIGISEATETEGQTSIYAVRIGLDGVHAVSPSGQLPINTYLPMMDRPGAMKKGEVEMVAAMAVKATRSAGVLRKIKIA